ncbi:PAS domain-containing protein [Rhodohalobacter sp. 8-1]|uniref:PAS domain-containing protein n=1 Tax=Rhodohalobacter sp. 8-1 TaxID=3131972 RepID=UPI0030EC4331
MKTPSDTIGDMDLTPDEFTRDELQSRLQPILERASVICDSKMSLINVLDETGPQTLAAYGDDDQQLISCVNRITDAAKYERDILVISKPDDHPVVTSQLSEEERQLIRFYAGTPLKSVSGKPVGYLCVSDSSSHDLSDDQQKQLQVLGDGARALLELYDQTNRLSKKNEKLNLYSLLLKNSADITFIIEHDSGRIMDVNSGVEKELGYQPDDLKGRLFTDIIKSNPFEGHSVDAWMSSMEKNRGRYVKPLQLIDHQQNASWFQCNFTTEDGRWFVTASDISEKKEAEQGVVELKEKFKKVVKVSTDLIYELEWNSGDLAWGDELTAVLGYPHEDRFVDYDWWIDKIHPEDLDRVIHDVAESVDSESDKMKLIYRIRTYEGSYKYVMNNNYVDRDEEGKPQTIIGAIVI